MANQTKIEVRGIDREEPKEEFRAAGTSVGILDSKSKNNKREKMEKKRKKLREAMEKMMSSSSNSNSLPIKLSMKNKDVR